jgi:hypothetical protein
MGPVVGPLAALLPCLLAQAVTVTVGDRSEARVRIQGDVKRFDVETRPSVRLGIATPRTALTLGYSPGVTELSVGTPDAQLIVYHTGFASGSLRFERTTLSLSQSATYGTQNFSVAAVALAPTAPPQAAPPTASEPTQQLPRAPGDSQAPAGPPLTPAPSAPVPTPGTGAQVQAVNRTVLFGASSTTAGIQHLVSRRVFAGASGGYDISGGLDEPSRASIPIQKGPFAGARVGYLATRVDNLTTFADARWVKTDDTVDARLYSAGEEWTHRFQPNLSGTLGAGAGFTQIETLVPPVTRTKRLDPAAGAAMTYAFGVRGAHVETSGAVRVSPVIDRFTGGGDQRVAWGLGVTWTERQLTLSGGVSGSRSVDLTNPNAISAYGGSAGAAYHLTPEWTVETGVRASKQIMAGFEPIPILWGAFVAVGYASTPIRF